LHDLASVLLALMKASMFFGLDPPWLMSRLIAAEGNFCTVACGTFSYGGKVQLV